MQQVENLKPKTKRRTDWKKIRRLSLHVSLNAAQAFLQGAAVAGGAAVVAKIVAANPKQDADVLQFPARRHG